MSNDGINYSNPCEFTSGSPIATWLTVLQFIFCTLSLLSSLILNASFTVIVIIHRALREQKELILCLVLTVSNICWNVSFSIFYMPSLIYGQWPFGETWCYVFGTIMLFQALLRNTFLLAITVDRFGAVMYPFQYTQHNTKMATVIFTVGGMHSAITSLSYNSNVFGCYNVAEFSYICLPDTICTETWCYFIQTIQQLLFFSSGIVAPLVLNIKMFYQAKKLRSTVTCGTSVEFSTGSGTEASQDIRGMVTIALLLASVVGLTLPFQLFFAAKITIHFPTPAGSPIALLGVLVFDIYALVPIADALVIWRNRDVKECAMSLWRSACKIVKTEH